eukprot:CAMPEP_0183298988 /NCGR_PEP_ID=MMETSP0160_2-20130417/5837_1 /TAXON_ID=2839 ORGANISM="Odontella Sinensis, Strain Grunow 1884" /NCGR_SAMPLE_ID=MMETSP0160_2 /ASSEMBLY_ACC=CAM_ASM_000250 /LENGTH=123 /DNA_ID=CAMNT_0025461125 /DNA_START=230 /DNA_END=597 /DNA_ORIENTATION=+
MCPSTQVQAWVEVFGGNECHDLEPALGVRGAKVAAYDANARAESPTQHRTQHRGVIATISNHHSLTGPVDCFAIALCFPSDPWQKQRQGLRQCLDTRYFPTPISVSNQHDFKIPNVIPAATLR